jgi:cytochrome c-type biogenesis protein CcmH
MKRCSRIVSALLAALVWVAAAAPALAVQPDEMLPDPALEARARTISAGLRCLVCQNQSIDESDADLAHDLRVLVRQRLVAGDTNAQVVAYLTARYGQFVLLKPRFSAENALLWGTPVLILAIGGIFLFSRGRKSGTQAEAALTPEEREKLARILEEEG